MPGRAAGRGQRRRVAPPPVGPDALTTAAGAKTPTAAPPARPRPRPEPIGRAARPRGTAGTPRAGAATLLELFQRVTGEEPVLWGSIVGFGHYHYRYASGREGDTAAVGFGPRNERREGQPETGERLVEDGWPVLLRRLRVRRPYRLPPGWSCISRNRYSP